MRFKVLVISIFIHFKIFSQYDFVENGNFEYFTTGGTFNYCGTNSGPTGWWNVQQNIENYWLGVWPWSPPIHTQSNIVSSVGSADLFCEYGIKGLHYAYTGSKEYIVAPLKKNLEIDKYYYVEFYFMGSYSNEAGIKFFNSKPKQAKSTNFIKDDGPVDINQDGYINTGIPKYPNSSIFWNKVAKYYKATANFGWIALGIFDGKEGGLQIDGIRIIEVGSSDCPEWNLIENTNYTDDAHLVYRSSYITGAGNDIDNNQDNGIVTIAAQSTVTLKSSNLIVMENGFSVTEGGTLYAYIAPCDSDCFPPTADAGADKVICDGTAVGGSIKNQLGTSATINPDVSYHWTATPATAISYLSCTDCPNPFINSSGIGYNTMSYQLTVSNACGQTATDNVKVVFDLNAFLYSPSVSATNINTDNYIDFDLTFNNHTEWIKIDIYKNSDNSLIYSKQLIRGDDFGSSTFHWEINQYLKTCDDYTVKIYSKNFCNENLSTIQIIPWLRDKTISIAALPNVFSPPNSPNAQLCYNATGVDEYEILVKDASGATIYSSSGNYAPLNGCLWDGSCNGSLSTCNNGYAPNATYFIVVTLKNCSTSVSKGHFVQLFRDIYKLANSDNISENSTNTKLYPNPNNGIFTIVPSYLMQNNYTIEITDAMNKMIYKAENQNLKNNNINLLSHGKGVYYVRVFNETENYFDKLIVN